MKKFFIYTIVLLFGLIMAGGQIYGATIYVHPGDKIQEAINDAPDGSVILIRDGLYKGPGNRNLDFNGRAIHVRSLYGPTNCIIDCEGIARAVYFHDGESSDTILEGITIRNGYSYDYPHGGGIYIHSSSPTIRNVKIYNCNADEYGGGIAVDGSSLPQIVDCRIESCAAYFGGGLSLCSSLAGNIIVENTYVRGNNASRYGGGLFVDTQNPIFRKCSIYDNESGIHGGGVWIFDADVAKFDDTWVVNNRSQNCGGGLLIDNCDNVQMKNCVLYVNEAVSHGGGMYVRRSVPTLGFLRFDNGYVFSNSAECGGGIAVGTNSYLILYGASFVNNANYAIWKINSPTTPDPWIIPPYNFSSNQPEDFNYQ